MTTAELRDAEQTLRLSRAFYERDRTARNAAVAEALAEGWTHARIAEATGLTRGRVGQIAQR